MITKVFPILRNFPSTYLSHKNDPHFVTHNDERTSISTIFSEKSLKRFEFLNFERSGIAQSKKSQ